MPQTHYLSLDEHASAISHYADIWSLHELLSAVAEPTHGPSWQGQYHGQGVLSSMSSRLDRAGCT